MFFSESPECNLINNRLGERFLKCTYCHYECVSWCENSEKKTISLPFRSIIWAPESCCSDWQLYLHPSSCSGPCFWQQSATAFSVSQEECVWAATPVEPAQTVTGTQLCSLFTVNAAQVIKLLIIVVNTDVYFLTTYVVSLTTQSAPSQINSLQFSFIYVAPNHSDSCLKVLYIQRNQRKPQQSDPPPPWACALVTIGKKKPLLTVRNLQQNHAQGGEAICCDPLGVRGRRWDKVMLWNRPRD